MIHTAEHEKFKLRKELSKAGCIGQRVLSPLRKVWEVYVCRGRVSEELRKRGDCEAEVFLYQTGWDFDRPKDRAAFLKRLKTEEPHEILITPACRLWSSLQELTASRSDEARRELMRKRQQDHDTHLTFTAIVYEAQRKAGEQGQWHPAKKPTTFRTTQKSLYNGLWRSCPGCPYHVPIEGRAKGFGLRSAMSENYPPKLAKKLAELLAEEPTEDDGDPIMPVDENIDAEGDAAMAEVKDKKDDDIILLNARLRGEVGPAAYNYVKRLHKSLGHLRPQPSVLKKMLMEVRATQDVLKAAKEFKGAVCYHRKPPCTVPPAAQLLARNFNDRVMADSARIDTDDGRKCVVTFLDHATKYVSTRILRTERSDEFIKGLERSWIKQFGVPHCLRVDEAKGWSSKLIREWCSDRGIALEVAPGEAHNWLAPVERQHQVVRKALEHYMAEKEACNIKTLEEACIYVPHQINNMSIVHGFSPAQWVFGRTPASTHSLTAELFNSGCDAIDEASKFAEIQRRRFTAQKAWVKAVKADCDAKLRRSMNKIFNETKDDMQIGQKAWFWRKAGSGILQKAKWRGPARIVAKSMRMVRFSFCG
eukprot:s105_g15.t1